MSQITVGRSDAATIRVTLPNVSGLHAAVAPDGPGLQVCDIGSTNGTSAGRWPGERPIGRQWVFMQRHESLYFGSSRVPVSWLLDELARLGHSSQVGRPTQAGQGARAVGAGHRLTISADQHADLRMPAEFGKKALVLERQTHGWAIGGRVVPVGGVVQIGGQALELTATSARIRPLQGQAALTARDLRVSVPNRSGGGMVPLLQGVSFAVQASELVCVLGPSGAGKSTLLRALTGIAPAGTGSVFVGHASVYEDYDELVGCIGFVPQDDIVHADLTVGQALFFSARLRLPSSVSDAEIDERVSRVLGELDLTRQRDLRIGDAREQVLSGGQRRRVNIGMELVADPLVLIADEPTSGLSSKDSVDVVAAFRRVAQLGRPVLLTIHQPSPSLFRSFDLALILAKGGHVAYYGPPEPHSFEFFNTRERDADAILESVERAAPEAWAERFRAHPLHRTFVASRVAEPPPARVAIGRQPPSALLQFLTLVRRAFSIKFGQPSALARYALPPLGIGGLMAAMFGSSGAATTLATPLFFLVMSSIFFGFFGAATEIVAERTIFRRERMVGLGIVPYLASKFVVLGTLAVVQSALLVLPLASYLGATASISALLGAALGATLASVCAGLLLSCLVPTEPAALLLVPIALVAQLLLSRFMPGTGSGTVVDALAATMTSRYAAEAVLDAERYGLERAKRPEDAAAWTAQVMEFRHYPTGRTERSLIIIGVQGLAFLLAAGVVLKAQDPKVLKVRAGV